MTRSIKWMDAFSLVFSLAVVTGTAVWVLQSGAFATPILNDSKLAWHLVRSAGIGAYLLLAISMVWGLLMSSQYAKDWSPGALSMTLHSSVSWLALVLGFGHAFLLLWDDYFTYNLSHLLVPFTGPYRPEAVGLGTLAFWLILVVTLSFSLKKRLGHRTWKWIHMTSYLAFVLVTAHALFAGTDASHLGLRLMLIGSVCVVTLMLGIRIGKVRTSARALRDLP